MSNLNSNSLKGPMTKISRNLLFVVLILMMLSCSGCALLQIPFQLLEGIINLASKLPMPPPGVFF